MSRAAAAAALSGVVVVLAVWVTSTASPGLLSAGAGHGSQTLPMLRHARHVRAHKASPQSAHPTGNMPEGLVVLGDVILLAVAAAGLALLVSAALHRNRRRRWRPPASLIGDIEGGVSALGVPPRLEEAARQQLGALRHGSPRNAIVACWMDLERACADAGLPRAPAETSTEFTARVLAEHAVAASAIETLARLYREARFSEHPLTEDHRTRAVAALEELLLGLTAPAHAVPSGGPT